MGDTLHGGMVAALGSDYAGPLKVIDPEGLRGLGHIQCWTCGLSFRFPDGAWPLWDADESTRASVDVVIKARLAGAETSCGPTAVPDP